MYSALRDILDDAAIRSHEGDLRGMDLAAVEAAMSEAHLELNAVELWLEALSAWRRRLEREAGDVQG